jgi:predicted dehydrogenase
VVRTGAHKGSIIDVEVPDMVLVTLDFGDDVLGFEDCGWCVRAAKGPQMQIFGTEGVISVNAHDEPHPLSIWRDDEAHNIHGWMDIDLHRKPRWSLVKGVEHLIECILDTSQPIVTSGEHARHVIEIMTQATIAAEKGRTMSLETEFPRMWRSAS